MRPGLRRFSEWAVYGFLRWFESFDSVWQTTLVCVIGPVVAAIFPWLVSLTFLVLVLSLYATFTQNGLAHENKLNSEKLDLALDEVRASTAAIFQLAQNEATMQNALIEQTEAMVEMLSDLREHLAAAKKPSR